MNAQSNSQQLHTAGGAAITGDVNTGGGDFVGRDFIQHIQEHVAIIGDDNIVGDGNAVIQHRGDVYLIQIGEWVGRLPQPELLRILTSTITVSESLQVYANPYRGLKPFTAEDAEFFFGRDALIAEMVAQLRRAPRFLAVVGPSGSGKSSVVQAGLLPALQRGDLPGSQDWQIVIARPSVDPYVSVDLSGFLKPDRSARTVLFLDQFEELFALCAPEVQTRFLDDLHALITGATPLTVILTLRADFYGHLQRSPLGTLLKHALVDVLPLTPAELRAAVEEPARRVGLDFEAGLVERIVDDARQAEHALPLLQSALAQVGHQQENGRLTYAAYQAVGGVAGALGLWAEDAYMALPAAEQILAQRIFTRLVHFHAGEGADTRQRQSLAVLAARPEEREVMHRLVRRLADARLLVTAEHEGEQTVEIIHDALLREWARLADWLTEQREFYLWRQRLDGQLQTWEAQARDESALLRGALLAEAEVWAASRSADLNTPEHRFIEASLKLREQERVAREQEQIAKEQQRRRLTLATVGAAVVFLVLALLAWGQRNIALDAQATAEAEAQYRATAQTETEAQRLEAVNAQAAAEARRIEAEEAEATARTERERAEQQAQISLARQLGVQAQYIMDQFPHQLPRTMLLAIESLYRYPEYTTNQIIAAGLELLPRQIMHVTHYDNVNVVAFSPDGQLVISGSRDNMAQVWETITGHEIALVMHEDDVNAVAFSPDGRWCISGSDDGTARVWEAETGLEVARMTHESHVNAIDYSPDGRWIVSGSSDNTARVWEATTGREVARMTHDGPVNTVDFSSDGRWIASGSNDGTVRVWQAATGRELARMAHENYVNVVAFSPDGQWVVSGSLDGTARVWETKFGREIMRIIHEKGVYAVAFSPEGHLVASAGCEKEDAIWCTLGSVRVWEVIAGKEVMYGTHRGRVNAVDFSPDGRWIVSGSDDDTARIWEAMTGQEVARMIHGDRSNVVAFSPNGQQIVLAGCDDYSSIICSGGSVWIWDVSQNINQDGGIGREVARITHSDRVDTISFNSDGQSLLWAECNSSISATCLYSSVWTGDVSPSLDMIEIDAFEITSSPLWDPMRVIVFSPNGRWVGESRMNSITLWDAKTGRALVHITDTVGVSALAFSPDGQWLVTNSDDNTAHIWDVTSGQEHVCLIHEDKVNTVAFSPDGRWVISGSGDGTARVWETMTGRETTRVMHGGNVDFVSFSPNGQWIVSGGRVVYGGDDTAQVWEATTGREVARMTLGPNDNAAVFSPDSRWVVFFSTNGYGNSTVRVWEVTNGHEVTRFKHDSYVNAVAFSPDGRWVVSGSSDNTARVWETATGREIARMTHEGPVLDVAFSPDGRWIASASEDGTVRVWWWQPDDIIDLACSRLPRNLTREEWNQYIGPETPYRATCPNLPVPEE